VRQIFLLAGMKAQRDERGGRILLGDNRRRNDRAAFDQTPVVGGLDFNWTPGVVKFNPQEGYLIR
jgi:hypothetical protein